MNSDELSLGAALAAILGTEGFLLAAIALALRLDEPNQDGVLKRPWIGPPRRVAKGAVWVMGLLALGALGAWWGIFGGGTWEGLPTAASAGALLVALVAQPILGWFLAYGAERE